MSVETAADRAALFDTDEWGEAATFTPDGGSPASVTVILSKASAEADLGEVGVNAPAHSALVRASDVASPAPGDALVVGAQTFVVDRADQDEIGAMWTLWLSEQ